MRIAVIGGGPGGLYLSSLVKRVDPRSEVVLWERGASGDSSGYGVVFSDGTLGSVQAADPELFDRLAARFVRWESVDVTYRGWTVPHQGYTFSAIERWQLSRMLLQRSEGLGVDLRFGSTAPPVTFLQKEFDVVVAADGVGSSIRAAHVDAFGARVEPRDSRYLWLATDRVFSALTFAVVETEHGPMTVHAYPYAPGRSTFILETTDRVLRASGLDDAGRTPDTALSAVAQQFSELLAGHQLFAADPRWGRFSSVINERWSHGNLALLGDAAHTTHFSIGSGTKLAMEDAVALAMALTDHRQVPDALAAYQEMRQPEVARMQRVAEISRDWFERLDEHIGRSPEEFAMHLLTRSGRIRHQDLPLTDRAQTDRVRAWFARALAAAA